MVDSTRLVDQLVAADDEIKRLRRELDDAKAHIHALEVDVSCLRGSCKAMGRDISIVRRQCSQYQSCVMWLLSNTNLSPASIPGRIRSVLSRIVDKASKRGMP